MEPSARFNTVYHYYNTTIKQVVKYWVHGGNKEGMPITSIIVGINYNASIKLVIIINQWGFNIA